MFILIPVFAVVFLAACGGSSGPSAEDAARTATRESRVAERTAEAQKTAAAPSPTATPEPVRYLGVVLHAAMQQEANDDSLEGPCRGIIFSGQGAVSEVFSTVLSKNSACFTVTGAPDPDAFAQEYADVLIPEGWTLTKYPLTGILGADGVGVSGTRKQGTERMAFGYANGALFLAVIPAPQ